MNAKPKLTLDTNILVYAFDKDAGDKQTTAIHIVDQAAEMDTVLLSEDFQHGRTLEGVQMIDPFQIDTPLEFLAS